MITIKINLKLKLIFNFFFFIFFAKILEKNINKLILNLKQKHLIKVDKMLKIYRKPTRNKYKYIYILI